MDTQYAIIGGGVVGVAIAYGLQRLGCQTTVLDEGDCALRASRGNFGLVWVQSKGIDAPHYARWSQYSAGIWSQLATDLEAQTGINLDLQQNGGYDIHLTEESLEQRLKSYNTLREQLDGDYPFEVLEPAQLRQEEPEIGPKVVGAILHHQDGHVNPLKLLKALHLAHRIQGGKLCNDDKVNKVVAKNRGYELITRNGNSIHADKVVVCAGLGSNRFAEQLGFLTRVYPLRGQNLVTEKQPLFINRPSMTIRQTNEGSIQLGDSKEDVGFDDGESMEIIAKIAKNAVATYPRLGQVNMIRNWGALRIMTKDGLPVYAESPSHSGCYLVTCHSGITLAAAHSKAIPLWLEGLDNAPNLEKFNEQRFSRASEH
ncbi:NAD(P)/FAD-dependent oxidoreductase [Ostreibacterium oceani]|uniref:FAD-dependent oxidoreductase n=1 Tax=Ostreibacterium oceani TaxID=2654998 RepID=A0A6N7F022_9GAMM|nr:FAD-binding oxidoreductase [Ostreibacterium oceani]MPV85186.1 FAD-dependent oxidoreductase [Ostreibacterium oceani]